METNINVIVLEDLFSKGVDHVVVDKLYWKLKEFEFLRPQITLIICDLLEHVQEEGMETNAIIQASDLYGQNLLRSKVSIFEQMEKEGLIDLFGDDGSSVRLKFSDSFLRSMVARLENIKKGLTPSSENNQIKGGTSAKPKLVVIPRETKGKQVCPRPTYRPIGK